MDEQYMAETLNRILWSCGQSRGQWSVRKSICEMILYNASTKNLLNWIDSRALTAFYLLSCFTLMNYR